MAPPVFAGAMAGAFFSRRSLRARVEAPTTPRPAFRFLGIERQDAIGGAEHRRETQVDQIDAGDAERDVAVGHHAAVQQRVDQIDERRFGRLEYDVGRQAVAFRHINLTKVGGHGPVSISS